MRTTITLDPDVHAAVREAAHRTGRSFKATLNDVVRAGLRNDARLRVRARVPEWPVFDLGAPLIDLTKAHALAHELEDQDIADKLARGK